METLNPNICGLAGIFVDDACLQSVWEAAGDPSICNRLYLAGTRPTCRAWYERIGTTTGEATQDEKCNGLSPTTPAREADIVIAWKEQQSEWQKLQSLWHQP